MPERHALGESRRGHKQGITTASIGDKCELECASQLNPNIKDRHNEHNIYL